MASSSSIQAARTIWLSADLPERFLAHLILNGEETSIKSSFRVTAAAQAAVGLSALSAAHFHTLRAGVEQSVSINARHAVLSFSKLSRKRILKMFSIFDSVDEFWYTVDGQLPQGEAWEPLAGIYPAKDGFVRIHTNFPQ